MPKTVKSGLTAREEGVWQIQWKKCHGDTSLVADVSQSAGRCPSAVSGKCPTLTPGGKVFVAKAKRCICSEEAMLLHGFPVKALKLPSPQCHQVS